MNYLQIGKNSAIKPQNFEERVVWYSILGTYVLYALGLLYIFNYTIAWVLLFYLCFKLWHQTPDTPNKQKIKIPWIMWLWIFCMLVMLVATYAGLSNFSYSNKIILRELILWGRTWALIALFPLAGCCLNIRPQLVYRANCLLCLQSLFVIPISCGAYLLKLPHVIYISPVKAITKSSSAFYDVIFYFKEIASDGGGFRLALFAPWPPALALLAMLFFIFALQEKNKKLRWIGLSTSILIALLTASRTAIVCLPFVLTVVFFLTNIYRVSIQILTSFVCFVSGIFSSFILDTIQSLKNTFTNSRLASSRVRDTLARISLERSKDAPIWGHGLLHPGFKGTEDMPIGSHHTWIGLLFIKGWVGFFAFLIPFVSSFIYLVIKAHHNQTAKVGLYFLLILLVYSFAENQEALSYLYWSGLLVMGIAFKEQKEEQEENIEKETVFSKPKVINNIT
ncbi:MAG: O-antigen ligase family protein [Rivularia sp. (in: cyanobacteria)]